MGVEHEKVEDDLFDSGILLFWKYELALLKKLSHIWFSFVIC